MADNEFTPAAENSEIFKEAVCIDAMRIYDSCSSKDCIEDIRVLFSTDTQPLVDSAANVRVRDVDVLCVYMDMQSIPFNRGYYSIDMTFFFDVYVDLSGGSIVGYERVNGLSVFNKKAILYGSEGCAKMFTSDGCEDPGGQSHYVLPKATVQVAKPVALSAKICDLGVPCGYEPCCVIPDAIAAHYNSPLLLAPQAKNVFVTIGLFTIVQIVRNVQMLIPAFDFCIPEKECVSTSDNPCELFRKIEFPTDEFFPPRPGEMGCGCNR